MSESQLFRLKEAARYLGISERLLWKLTSKGSVPVVRLGRTVRYARAALDRIIEKGGTK